MAAEFLWCLFFSNHSKWISSKCPSTFACKYRVGISHGISCLETLDKINEEKFPDFVFSPYFVVIKVWGFLCFKIIMIFGTAIKYLHINSKIISRKNVDIKLKTDQKASLSTIDPNLSLSSNPSFEHNDGKLKTEFFNCQNDTNLEPPIPVNSEAFASW